jgi:hypothetical protein
MILDERDIGDRDAALANEALSTRFGLREARRQVAPAIFTQVGALVRDEISGSRLANFLSDTAELPVDPSWAALTSNSVADAKATVEQRFDTLSFAVVAGSGLLDGINPCAFATIIFLLSYLQVARRKPGEILAVGPAFISAVFLAYFAVGLGLSKLLSQLAGMQTAGLIVNYVLAGFALVVALLSFRDARLAARGEAREMTLQLPGVLKEQIRGVIRSGTKARHFVAAAFGIGILISLLELACTGQVYLPTIQFMLQAGRTDAVVYLLAYNVAFVLPLVAIFLLAFFGLRSEALIKFQQRHTALVKVLTGVLFLGLTAMLLFGVQIARLLS